jgi:hypothetical protein
MGHRPRVRVRGIYATALTVLLLEQGFRIVDASRVIQTRFGIPGLEDPEDVCIVDRRSRQGILLEGAEARTIEVVRALQQALPQAVFSPDHGAAGRRWQGEEAEVNLPDAPEVRYLAEFPATVKGQLDRLRSLKVPTVPGHHAFKIVDASAVEEAEARLAENPSRGEVLLQGLRERLVYPHFRLGAEVLVRHLKAGGPQVKLRGQIERFTSGSLVLVRAFRGGGTYDGLGLPIKRGDWGTMTLQEGEWVTVRRYFRQGGALVGEFYNIGTPVEFYPDHLRYVDLELDVVRLPDGSSRLEDADVLVDKLARGLLPPALGQQAIRVAARLLQELAREQPPTPTGTRQSD